MQFKGPELWQCLCLDNTINFGHSAKEQRVTLHTDPITGNRTPPPVATTLDVNDMNHENFNVGDLWQSNHASVTYQAIVEGGPPAQPLEFPTPWVCRVACFTVRVLDHKTGRPYEQPSVLCRTTAKNGVGAIDQTADRAYILRKRTRKTVHGHIRLCSILRRRHNRAREEFKDVEWEYTSETVVMKASSWCLIRQSQKQRAPNTDDPQREAAALQYIGDYHPNILGCLEVLQDNDFLYVVMPHCPGGDLYAKMLGNSPSVSVSPPASPSRPRNANEKTEALLDPPPRFKPDEEQARFLFQQLLQALYHLQKKGVSHRDLSMENILMDENDRLVIVDFGMAIRVPYIDMSNVHAVSDVSEGTQRRLIVSQGQGRHSAYVAPEIVECKEAFDGFAVDLWSAGVILFVLLVGRMPFRTAHPSDYHYSHINRGQLRDMMRRMEIRLSDSVCNLLQNMFWRDPGKRLTLSQVMTHPWVVGHSGVMDDRNEKNNDKCPPTQSVVSSRSSSGRPSDKVTRSENHLSSSAFASFKSGWK